MGKHDNKVIAIGLLAFVGLIMMISSGTIKSQTLGFIEMDSIVQDSITPAKPEFDTLDLMATAFINIESEGNVNAYNKKTGAAGCLQIMPICVDEVNRLLNIEFNTKGVKYYTYSDRYDMKKSKEIFAIIMRNHNKKMTIQHACRVWNPNHGKSYLTAVTNEYKKLIEGM